MPPFSSTALATLSASPGPTGMITPVDPIYVATYSDLRGIYTGSLLCLITGRLTTGAQDATINAGWFQADPNDKVTADDNGITTIVSSVNGYRWKRMFATGLPVAGDPVEYPTFPANTPFPWTAIGYNKIVEIYIGGVRWPLNLFTIAGGTVVNVAPGVQWQPGMSRALLMVR